MQADPCAICGGTDVNLIDGYYYCVECGTQDVNARETVVEQTMLGDGTFARTATRKFTTAMKEGIEMSGEWHKWHTFNFILCGLADELVELGARPSFKKKVLWVWTRYIKEFQVKEDQQEASQLYDKDEIHASQDEDIENSDEEKSKRSKKQNNNKHKDICVVTIPVMVAILYIALNLDQSDLQLYHIFRYVRDGRLSISDYIKFIPKELNTKSIPHWKSFLRSTPINSPNLIRKLAMSLFKGLDLGTPLVPDLSKIIDNYVKELSLPNGFKNLVFSLMNLAPCDFLDVGSKKGVIRVPDFEGVAMSYVLVALKMCFGLDGDYEIMLSNAVDKINYDENYMKSHKLGMIAEPTDRLFSFKEWCNYLQFRKTMLCKYYLPMAKQHNLDVDDYVFMEQSGERPKRKTELHDEVSMDILNKIQLVKDTQVIPKTEFLPSLTPISTYTEVIIEYVQNPELKLLLSEDFTQYSLEYACLDLKLLIQEENIIIGVHETNKTVNPVVVGTLVSKTGNFKMVYVRNCENKNWLKTKPPTEDHITKIVSDKENDPGYDSNVDNTAVEVESMEDNAPVEVRCMTDNKANTQDDTTERELELIEEEITDKLIFDDTFEDLREDKKAEPEAETDNNYLEFNYEPNTDYNDNQADVDDSKSDTCNLNLASFNPVTFDRENTIKELILTACKKYKIPIPREYDPKEPRKRKPTLVHIGAGQSDAKKRKVSKRLKPGESKIVLNRIFAAYYNNVDKDVLNRESVHVNSILQNLHIEGLAKLEEELESKSSMTQHISRVCDQIEDVNQNHSQEILSTLEHNTNPTNFDYGENHENNVIDNSDEEDLLPRINPKFDTKTYDASQLYVKFRQEVNLDDILDYDDPEIEKFLDNKISEFTKNQPIELCTENVNESKNCESDSEDEDDDIPLAIVANKKKLLLEKKLQMKNLEPLIKTAQNFKDFKYWFRHYTTSGIVRNIEMKQKFNLELEKNCPSSFNLVIHECAAILDYSAYSLYKHMQDVEQLLLFKASKK